MPSIKLFSKDPIKKDILYYLDDNLEIKPCKTNNEIIKITPNKDIPVWNIKLSWTMNKKDYLLTPMKWE